MIVSRIALERRCENISGLSDFLDGGALGDYKVIFIELPSGQAVLTMFTVHLVVLILLHGVSFPDFRILFSITPTERLPRRLGVHG